jgi:hypothetical protein
MIRQLAVFLFAVALTVLTVGADYLHSDKGAPPPTVAIFVFWYVVGLVMSYSRTRSTQRRESKK